MDPNQARSQMDLYNKTSYEELRKKKVLFQ